MSEKLVHSQFTYTDNVLNTPTQNAIGIGLLSGIKYIQPEKVRSKIKGTDIYIGFRGVRRIFGGGVPRGGGGAEIRQRS